MDPLVKVLPLFFFLFSSLLAADFDVIVVGTSPFSLFEALYQSHSGKKVLILEEAAECGGAWKSIYVCGIPHVDLGCHQVGCNTDLKTFLEDYAGCTIVPQEHPTLPFTETQALPAFYFSKGCHELIDHLLQLIGTTDIVLLTHTKLESVSFDLSRKIATAHTKSQNYSTRKFIVTPMSCFGVEPISPDQNFYKSKYYHLYLLVQDPTPPRFSYRGSVGNGITRAMNLSHFVGLDGTGQHLIVLQVPNEWAFTNSQDLLNTLKKEQLIADESYILKCDPYIYEAGTFSQRHINQAQAQEFFEVLQTGQFGNLAKYMPKWMQILKPYREAIIGN